jgi:ribosomal protein L11 methyltransferase
MFSLELDSSADGRDLLIAELWELGSAGIAELSETRVRAFFETCADRADLLARYPGAALREEEQRDWVQESRDMLQPMEVGRRFFLVPVWRDDPAPAGRFRIAVNPGLAFGTGVHETTRLCLEALEELVRPGITVLDVGTGSGILAEAAHLLGAARVIACDVDPDAIHVARQGFIGSADAVRSATVDLVVANISPEAIVALAPEFARVLRPGGTLIASGFNFTEVETVRIALTNVREVRQKGEWAAIVAGPSRFGCQHLEMAVPNWQIVVPTETDWRNYNADLDQEWAHRQFAGRTNAEMLPGFDRDVIERTEDLQWMPAIPFRYYMLGFRDYILAGKFTESFASDAASCFLRLVLVLIEEEPAKIAPIMPELLPALRYVGANQALFDAKEEIYGSFPAMVARIESLSEPRGARSRVGSGSSSGGAKDSSPRRKPSGKHGRERKPRNGA